MGLVVRKSITLLVFVVLVLFFSVDLTANSTFSINISTQNERNTTFLANSSKVNISVNELSNFTQKKLNMTQQTPIVTITRSPIILGQEVRWKKNITTTEETNIALPAQAKNISVQRVFRDNLPLDEMREIQRSYRESVIEESELILKENESYIVEFVTPAPVVVEEETESGKRVIISAEEDLNYTDIISFTTIPEKIQVEDAISLVWVEESEEMDFITQDTDNNGWIDRIEWITPHLSTQTFEITLTVLNIQSYPAIGGEWTVAFETTGTADLIIAGDDGTLFDTDIGS
jgi:hypothetical protein